MTEGVQGSAGFAGSVEKEGARGLGVMPSATGLATGSGTGLASGSATGSATGEGVVGSETLDPGFKYEVAARPGGENIKACFACGVCTAGCPVAEIDPQYNPRRIIRMVLLGLRREVLSSDIIWLCTSCFTCYAHCPQDVKFTDVMKVLREMAVEEGYVHPSFPSRIEALDEAAQRIRREMAVELVSRKAEDATFDLGEVLSGVTRRLGLGRE